MQEASVEDILNDKLVGPAKKIMRSAAMRHAIQNTSSPVLLEGTFATYVRQLRRAAGYVHAVLQVARERHALAGLDERMLKDIGMSRSLAEQEIARPLLDIPADRIEHRF